MYNIADHLSIVPGTNYRTMTDQQLQLSPEQLREKLRKQLEYYFSKENMIHDTYLQSQMDADFYVPITLIANFKLVKRLTHDLQLIVDVLKESPSVEVDTDEKRVRSSDSLTYLPPRKRCTIILRNVPLDATENEILELFSNESCPALPTGCERVLESNHSDCWYVTFNNEDEAQNAFLYLTRENVAIRGQKILARMKACLWQKIVTVPNDGAKDTSVVQNSSSNSVQEQYTPVNIQSIPTNHINSSISLGHLSQHRTLLKPRPMQVLQQYLPINSNSNISVPQHNIPSTVLFTANSQPFAMNYYPHTTYMNRNHSIFPINVWYLPPTADSYSSMGYNLQSKLRVPTASKPRNSAKPTSSQVEVSNTQNHLNETSNSSQSSTSHLEDSVSSTTHRNDNNAVSSSDRSSIDDNRCKLQSTDETKSSIDRPIEQPSNTKDSANQYN